MTKHFRIAAAVSFGLLASPLARAQFSITGTVTATQVADLVRPVIYGFDFQSYRSASPLGMVLGLDVGADLTALSFPSSFTSVITAVGGTLPSSVLPLVRIQIHKGLPAGIDIGGMWFGITSGATTLSMWGLTGQWSFLPEPIAIAARVTYTNSTIAVVQGYTLEVGTVVSKKLGPLDPFVGLGYEFGGGTLTIPATQFTGSIPISSSFGAMKFFAGLEFKMLILKIGGQYGYNFYGFSSYGAKATISI